MLDFLHLSTNERSKPACALQVRSASEARADEIGKIQNWRYAKMVTRFK